MKYALLLLIISVFPVAGVYAAPDEVVGKARFSYLFWDVYDSTLYTDNGKYFDGIRPVKLALQYQREISARQLMQQTVKEWKRQGKDPELYKKWLGELKQFWPDVKEHDVLSVLVNVQGESIFYFNGKQQGMIEDARFGQAFLDIWLSEETSQPDHRAELLGESL